MKILILGGSGFVGTRLTELLKEDHQVTIGDLVKSEFYPELWKHCDVCVDDDLRSVMAGQDCVVNLAASHRDDVHPISLYTRNNIEGAEHVCKIATELGVHFIVFTSSVAVYGFTKNDYDEDAPKNPFNEYGRTKLIAESVYTTWQKADPKNIVHIIRPSVIFGERNRGNVYNLFKQLASGRFLMVGNGKNKKSMAYVGNVAAFLKWEIEENKQSYSIYNYVDKPDYDMHDLVNGFEKALGKKLPPISLPYWLGLFGGYCFDFLAFITRRNYTINSIRIKKFCAQTVFSSDKMMKSGFKPPFDMQEALRKTVDFEFGTSHNVSTEKEKVLRPEASKCLNSDQANQDKSFKPMKILFLTHYYFPEGNAPATRVSALAERWVKMGHDVTVMTSAPNVPNGIVYEGYRNKWTSKETINGVKVIRIWTFVAPNRRTIRRILNYSSYMVSALIHGLFLSKPDVMIATSPQFFCGWAGVLLHWFKGFPFMLEIRDIWPESISTVNAKVPSLALRIVFWMEKVMYRTASFIVTVGEGYRQKLIYDKHVPEDKLAIIMNGVDTEHFYPRPKDDKLLSQYGLNGKFICSYVGTIGMACGLGTVLNAAEQLKKQGDDSIRFLLVGDGAIRKALEKEANERELDNVVFVGRRPKEEIPSWIASSDVNLIHLKKTDLFKTVMPSKIFESAGCARPVIIGVEGFAKEFIEKAEAGIAMEPENENDLLQAIQKLKNNPAFCKQLGDNGYKNICPKYNRDQQAKDYFAILESFVHNSSCTA